MKQKITLLISFLFLFVAGAQADWIAGNSSVQPSSPIPACGTLTATGTYSWLSFNSYYDSIYSATLTYSLPPSLIASSGTPSLLVNNIPFSGAIFTLTTGGWDCTFPPGTIFAPGTQLTFSITNIDIVNTPSFSFQQLDHSISFGLAPPGDNPVNNSSTIIFNTSAVPTVIINATATTLPLGQSLTLTASGAITYIWDSVIVQNGVPFMPPVGTHVYTVTGTDANGCTATSSVTITVNGTTGNWIAGDETVSPSSTIPACSTVTLSGSFTWLSFDPFPNDNHTMTLSYNLPACVTIASGTPTLFYQNNTPVIGTSFTQTATGYDCTFASGIIFPAGTKFIFQIANLAIIDSPAFVFQPAMHSISFVTPAAGENASDNSKTISFSTIAVPTATVAAAASAICSGDNAIFTISGAATDVVTYTINGGAPATATIGSGGTVDVTVTAAAINQTIALTQVQDANCITALTDSITITVNASPFIFATTSSTSICAGDSVTLAGFGGTSYTWNNSVVDGIAFAPAATTTYTVTGTDANGCTATSTVTVAVNALPVVAANATNTVICAGDLLTLTGSGAATYAWDNSVVNGIAFAPNATTTYTVTGTDANACFATASVTVTVNALPVVGINPSATDICTGGMLTLAGTGAATYFWDNSVIDATPFTPAATNTYTVTGTDANACTATSSITITVNAIPVAPSLSVTHPICATDSGTINISAPLGANYEYSVDSINYQLSPNFSLPAGIYNVVVRDTATAICASAATVATLNANATPCGPNVAVGAQSLPSSIAEGGSAVVNYFVSNVGTSPTFGAINILIAKPSNGTLTFTLPPGWTITSNTSGSIFLASTNSILPGLINRTTIPAVYVHDNTNEDAVKSSNIKAASGSGGETITNNNEGQTYIQIN